MEFILDIILPIIAIVLTAALGNKKVKQIFGVLDSLYDLLGEIKKAADDGKITKAELNDIVKEAKNITRGGNEDNNNPDSGDS